MIKCYVSSYLQLSFTGWKCNPKLCLEELISDARKIFQVVILLCQRSSAKLNEEQREKLWFSLLDTTIDPRKSIKDLPSDEASTLLIEVVARGLAQHVLNSMMGHMPLPAVLQKVIQVPVNYSIFSVQQMCLLYSYWVGTIVLYRCNHTQ